MTSALAELERVGGGRKVSLVQKRSAKHNQQEVAPHVEPVDQLVQRQRRSLWDMESHSFSSDLGMVFDTAIEFEDTNCVVNDARSSTCDEGAGQHRCEAGVEIISSKG